MWSDDGFGADAVFCQDFAVSTVPVFGGSRLKNICSMGGPDTIIISDSDGAKKTLRVSITDVVKELWFISIIVYVTFVIFHVEQMMEQLTDHHYDVLSVSEDAAANCVYIRSPAKVNYLLHPTADECPNSIPVSQRITLVISSHPYTITLADVLTSEHRKHITLIES